MSRFVSLFVLCFMLMSATASARLEVCNQTDLVLMVAVGYDTTEERTVSEGWWRLYPGTCEVPVDVALLKGRYYVHAESNPRSTMPGDAFTWGNGASLCTKSSDFRNTNGNQCGADDIAIEFSALEKNWRNQHTVDVYHNKRTYQNQFRARMAGIQRMLSIIGYDIGDIDGVAGEKTVNALNELGVTNGVFGFDFDKMFPLLEQVIAQRQKLDN